MRDHVHTGPIAVLFAGLSAILVIHLLRILAGLMPDGVARESLASFALAD